MRFLPVFAALLVLSCARIRFWSESQGDFSPIACQEQRPENISFMGNCWDIDILVPAMFVTYLKTLYIAQLTISKHEKVGTVLWDEAYNRYGVGLSTVNRLVEEMGDKSLWIWMKTHIQTERNVRWLEGVHQYEVSIHEVYKYMGEQGTRTPLRKLSQLLVDHSEEIFQTVFTARHPYPEEKVNRVVLQVEEDLNRVVNFWNERINKDVDSQKRVRSLLQDNQRILYQGSVSYPPR